MIIKEVTAAQYDKEIISEPDASIFQSSLNVPQDEKIIDVLYLLAEDEDGMREGMGMFILKKDSLLSLHYTAYSPNGYLVNFYDEDIFREFDAAIKKHLRARKCRKIVIEPQVEERYTLVNDNFTRMGYTKTAERRIFMMTPGKRDLNMALIYKQSKADEFIVKHSDVFDAKTKAMVEAFKPYLKVCSLIKEYRNEGDQFEQAVLAQALICEFGKRADLILLGSVDEKFSFNPEEILLDYICKDLHSRKFRTFCCKQSFPGFKETKLLGELTSSI